MKTLSILGSTGSIGTQTLDIVRKFPEQFKVSALSCNSNIGLLKEQIDEFKPKIAAVFDEEKADILKDSLKADIPVYKGMEGIVKAAVLGEAHTVVNSLVGSIGILPTVKAIENLKNVALANKETLVAAGEIVMKKLRFHKTALLPIDSEHSAILQCIRGENLDEVSKVTLTCSGGAFRETAKEELEDVKASDALKHPTWSMGPKITIDSATLMNKGFEVIEAHFLYNIPYSQIDVVIHPQSTIHSMVEFKDGSVMAQLGAADMRIPIQYALAYPKRMENKGLSKLNLAAKGKLEFYEPSLERFPCLAMAYDSGIKGGSLPAVMNAANEIAVRYFLMDKIRFTDIPKIIMEELEGHKQVKDPNLDDILNIDRKVKEDTEKKIREMLISR
ncbi:1-deoxy-D-xylulose-5-phosphate reductoisomerase [Candidatus Woesearchaeota archaeon]|nr:1-deoxy-D-xylulose-5-phosphate reductoisomerase [Candidatus Woesearchaeota archaeon]